MIVRRRIVTYERLTSRKQTLYVPYKYRLRAVVRSVPGNRIPGKSFFTERRGREGAQIDKYRSTDYIRLY